VAIEHAVVHEPLDADSTPRLVAERDEGIRERAAASDKPKGQQGFN
jgi:hypothetical protein